MAPFILLVPEASRGRMGVEPDVDALHQIACHVHIVIIQKDQLVRRCGRLDLAVDFLIRSFAGFISGCALPANDLNRLAGIGHARGGRNP